MPTKRDSLKFWVEVTKDIAEILAIIIARIWTYNLFLQKEAPTLERRATLDSNLTWTKLTNSNNCEAVMRVHFENIGTSTIDISKVSVRGWKFRLEKPDAVFAEYFDLEKIQSAGELFFEKIYDLTNNNQENLIPPFIQHYAPGDVYTHTFTWVITPQENSQVAFFVQLFSKSDSNQQSWKTYAWGSNDCK